MNDSTNEPPPLSREELRGRLERQPRLHLTHLPTPLQECPRLSPALGGARLLVKRDDMTGLAFGGAEARMLDFALAQAHEEGADTLITGSEVAQSNLGRLVAAAAARLGMRCVLVLRPGLKGPLMQGNLLVDHVLGADVRLVEPLDPVAGLWSTIEQVAAGLRAEGRRPFLLRPDERMALGYVEGALEMAEQLEERHLRADFVFVCSAGAIQAGLLAGWRALRARGELIGVSPARAALDQRARIASLAQRTAQLLDLRADFGADDVINLAGYVGTAYAMPTPASMAAMAQMARSEGIILDPVYTAKAFAAVLEYGRNGKFTPDHTVVFVHTGGTPALFAYSLEIAGGMPQ